MNSLLEYSLKNNPVDGSINTNMLECASLINNDTKLDVNVVKKVYDNCLTYLKPLTDDNKVNNHVINLLYSALNKLVLFLHQNKSIVESDLIKCFDSCCQHVESLNKGCRGKVYNNFMQTFINNDLFKHTELHSEKGLYRLVLNYLLDATKRSWACYLKGLNLCLPMLINNKTTDKAGNSIIDLYLDLFVDVLMVSVKNKEFQTKYR
eukprot:UN33714